MHQVLAAGIIIFRDTNPNFREYLLLQKDHCKSENWAPPKGRLEPNESDFDAAAREVFEETGLRISVHFDLISNYWTVTNSYQSGSKNKRVVYWLGKIKPECDRKIQLSEEHVNFKWYSINEVLESLPSEHMTQALVKADEFLALNSENLNKIE